jgi:tetratricopeptide (TPR) repeat protein
LPGWQRFYAAHRASDFEFIAVALEHAGPEAARPFVARAGATFPVAIDEHGLASALLGFKVVPNGVLVDRDGTIRYAKYGGFSVDRVEDVAAVERFIRGDEPGPSPDHAPPYALGSPEQELVATRLRLGRLLDAVGHREEALAEWQAALRLDPGNLVIRKQIWAVRYPERFHPVIDWAWQKDQLARERAAEVAAGICGPDGCPLPRHETR